MVAVGAGVVAWIYSFTLTDKNATERDFIQYWAAEQQLAHRADPYDIESILRREQAAGLEGDSPKVTFSPPVAYVFALPLGYMRAKTGLIVWLLLQLACVGAACWIFWLLHGRPQSRYHLLAFAFPPTLSCLTAGQLGIFFLLEVVLFLFFYERRPWLAGASLVFCALKPHLFLPCLVVLLLWSARRRQFRILGGFVCALVLSGALTLSLDREVWSQYAQMMRSTRLMDVFLPTLSVTLRFLIHRHATWLEFVPEGVGCV
jgi:Glycosyltransferase family 87